MGCTRTTRANLAASIDCCDAAGGEAGPGEPCRCKFAERSGRGAYDADASALDFTAGGRDVEVISLETEGPSFAPSGVAFTGIGAVFGVEGTSDVEPESNSATDIDCCADACDAGGAGVLSVVVVGGAFCAAGGAGVNGLSHPPNSRATTIAAGTNKCDEIENRNADTGLSSRRTQMMIVGERVCKLKTSSFIAATKNGSWFESQTGFLRTIAGCPCM